MSARIAVTNRTQIRIIPDWRIPDINARRKMYKYKPPARIENTTSRPIKTRFPVSNGMKNRITTNIKNPAKK
jgi:hypothetical protein